MFLVLRYSRHLFYGILSRNLLYCFLYCVTIAHRFYWVTLFVYSFCEWYLYFFFPLRKGKGRICHKVRIYLIVHLLASLLCCALSPAAASAGKECNVTSCAHLSVHVFKMPPPPPPSFGIKPQWIFGASKPDLANMLLQLHEQETLFSVFFEAYAVALAQASGEVSACCFVWKQRIWRFTCAKLIYYGGKRVTKNKFLAILVYLKILLLATVGLLRTPVWWSGIKVIW